VKIFISTMHAAHNYGAALQAFSLQTTLRKMGYDSQFVQVKQPRYPKLVFPKNILKIPFFLLNFWGLYKSDVRFNQFRENFMCTTDTYCDEAMLIQRASDADVYLAGSDQVWNPLSAKPRHFFCYVPDEKKKISYAASMGIDYIPDNKLDFFKTNVNRFSHISVREESAKEILKEITEKTIEVNIDPVFLQTADQWQTIMAAKPIIKKPYILVYVLYRPPWLNDALKVLHKKTGMEIVLVSDSSYRRIYRTKTVYSAGPQEFLRLFEDASAVVTSSFHGTAFSMIFRKPFYAIVNPKAPTRITSLLKMFGLESVIASSQKDFDSGFSKFPDDFEEVWKRERERSLKYLKKAIEN